MTVIPVDQKTVAPAILIRPWNGEADPSDPLPHHSMETAPLLYPFRCTMDGDNGLLTLDPIITNVAIDPLLEFNPLLL
jgi:hypothetical protein